MSSPGLHGRTHTHAYINTRTHTHTHNKFSFKRVTAAFARADGNRFVPLPQVELTLTVPVEGLGDSSKLELINTLKFNLPNDTDFVVGRSFSNGHERSDLYQQVETFLDGYGLVDFAVFVGV